MSKGLSKMQDQIMGALYRHKALVTFEVVDWLLGAGYLRYDNKDLPYETIQKMRMATVRRACSSLQRRKLIVAHYYRDVPYADGGSGRITVQWALPGESFAEFLEKEHLDHWRKRLLDVLKARSLALDRSEIPNNCF